MNYFTGNNPCQRRPCPNNTSCHHNETHYLCVPNDIETTAIDDNGTPLSSSGKICYVLPRWYDLGRGWLGGLNPSPPPPPPKKKNSGQLRFLGAAREILSKLVFKEVPMLFFGKIKNICYLIKKTSPALLNFAKSTARF